MLARANFPIHVAAQAARGMWERVMIAMALACDPALLIADDPKTALDVTIQAQILQPIRTLQGQMDISVLFTTHNLGVMAQGADRVAVMCPGASSSGYDVDRVRIPHHPYTRALPRSIPHVRWPRPGAMLLSIPGQAEPFRLATRMQLCTAMRRAALGG